MVSLFKDINIGTINLIRFLKKLSCSKSKSFFLDEGVVASDLRTYSSNVQIISLRPQTTMTGGSLWTEEI